MATREKVYTVDEFEDYAATQPDRLLELVHGRITEKVTTDKHGVIALRQWQTTHAMLFWSWNVTDTPSFSGL